MKKLLILIFCTFIAFAETRFNNKYTNLQEFYYSDEQIEFEGIIVKYNNNIRMIIFSGELINSQEFPYQNFGNIIVEFIFSGNKRPTTFNNNEYFWSEGHYYIIYYKNYEHIRDNEYLYEIKDILTKNKLPLVVDDYIKMGAK